MARTRGAAEAEAEAQQSQTSAQDAAERKLFRPPEREPAAHLLVVLSAPDNGSIWRQQPRGERPQMLLQSEGVRRNPLTRLPRQGTHALGSLQVSRSSALLSSTASSSPIKLIFPDMLNGGDALSPAQPSHKYSVIFIAKRKGRKIGY